MVRGPYAVFAPKSSFLPASGHSLKRIRRVSHFTSRVNLESFLFFQVSSGTKDSRPAYIRVRVQWLPISSWRYIEEEL